MQPARINMCVCVYLCYECLTEWRSAIWKFVFRSCSFFLLIVSKLERIQQIQQFVITATSMVWLYATYCLCNRNEWFYMGRIFPCFPLPRTIRNNTVKRLIFYLNGDVRWNIFGSWCRVLGFRTWHHTSIYLTPIDVLHSHTHTLCGELKTCLISFLRVWLRQVFE